MNPTLQRSTSDSARARVARHDREDQGERRDHDVVAASELRVEKDQARQQREIREAIER
jgi:hypothetical protein